VARYSPDCSSTPLGGAWEAATQLDSFGVLYYPNMQEISIAKWSDFDQLMEHGGRFTSWAFRGQRDADWQMWTSLSRHLRDFGVQPDFWPAQEARIIRIFKRKAHLHLTHVPDNTDTFQWLALIQHYGGPTRLLDFTWSPYVAAFFALETATSDAAVYALDTRAVSAQPTSASAGENPNLRTAGTFESLFLPGEAEFVGHAEPGVLNPRLIAQLGTFIVPSILDQSAESVIERACGPDALVKLRLMHSLRDEAMRSLYGRNVHNTSLFPDLNGLAASLRYELETHWAFDVKTGAEYPGWGLQPYAKSTDTSIVE